MSPTLPQFAGHALDLERELAKALALSRVLRVALNQDAGEATGNALNELHAAISESWNTLCQLVEAMEKMADEAERDLGEASSTKETIQ